MREHLNAINIFSSIYKQEPFDDIKRCRSVMLWRLCVVNSKNISTFVVSWCNLIILRTMEIKLFTIPNMLTLSNLICGSLAINTVVANGDYRVAFGLLIAAAVFDFMDGFAARLLGCSSPLGVQLDSLADMVSFGVAPAMILSTLIAQSPSGMECEAWREYGRYIPYIIVAFSALRLAKFNIDTEQSSEFIGLPTPACAMFSASLGLMFCHGVVIKGGWVALISIILALLLISPIRMFALKFKSFAVADNKLRYSFLAVALLLLIVQPLFAIASIVTIYILISIIRAFVKRSN